MSLELFPHQKEDSLWMAQTKRCIIGSDMGTGKEQPFFAEVYTPTGPKRICDLMVGEEICDSEGCVATVEGIFPQGEKDYYEVEFMDGTTAHCGIEHLWAVQTPNQKWKKQGFKVKSLEEIIEAGLHDKAGNRKFFVPITKPVQFKQEESLPYDPYLIGVLIGNGCLKGSVCFSTWEDDIIPILKSCLPEGLNLEIENNRYGHYKITSGVGKPNPLRRYLKDVGLNVKSPEKVIPREFLFASVKNRIALLQGLMDTDGGSSKTIRGTHTEYSSSSQTLANQVVWLIRSLGGRANLSVRTEPTYTHKGEKRIGLCHYRVSVSLPANIEPFRSKRKASRYKPNTKYLPAKGIESITKKGKALSFCIKTSAENSLYLTNDFIVTHNTAQAIQAAKYALKQCQGDAVLVVCPASLKENWKREIAQWWPSAPVTILTGTPAKRKAILNQFQRTRGFLIVNYEQVAAKKGKEFSEQLLLISKIGFSVMIADESHILKQRTTLNYKGASYLAYNTPYLFLMTGTPIMNRITDMWTLLHMIDKGQFSSYWKFVDHPVWGCGKVQGNYGWTTGDKSKNPEAFKAMLAPYFRRRIKQDVLKDLPPMTIQRLWIDLHPSEQAVYRSMEKEWMARLKGGQEISAPVVISQITRMKQFCVSPDLAAMPLSDGASYGHGWHTSKFLALLELIQSTDQKIVVFSQFEKAITLLEEMCRHYGIGMVRHTGRETQKSRDLSLDSFRCDPNIQVVGLTTQSGGLGLNLTESSIAVFLDKMWVPAQNEQAAARIHRPGQKFACTVYELLIKNSIESWLVEEKLQGKKDLIKEIIKMHEESVKEEYR